MPTGHYLTQEQIGYIRANFANTPNRELARALGVSLSSVSNVQRKYGLTKSAEHSHAMHRLSGIASGDSWGKIELTPEVLAKRAASFKRTYQKEKARVMFGLEQKTKIRVIRVCERARDQKSYLKSRGYIIDNTNKIAYWTEGTRRSFRLEKIPRGKRVGKMLPFYEFRPYSNNDDNSKE